MADNQLRIVLHAPTADGLRRARSNVTNLLRDDASLVVNIVVNAEGVPMALDNPDPLTDQFLLICRNTLEKLGRESPSLTTVASGVRAVVEMQQDGWTYVRA